MAGHHEGEVGGDGGISRLDAADLSAPADNNVPLTQAQNLTAFPAQPNVLNRPLCSTPSVTESADVPFSQSSSSPEFSPSFQPKNAHKRALSDAPANSRPEATMTDNVIERFPIPLPQTDVRWQGIVISTHRPQGRRIQVRSNNGVLLFDSLDCFDRANAVFKLDEWLTEIVGAIVQPAPVAALDRTRASSRR
jgi:hypothetical protein